MVLRLICPSHFIKREYFLTHINYFEHISPPKTIYLVHPYQVPETV
jgi:hypothetical protein